MPYKIPKEEEKFFKYIEINEEGIVEPEEEHIYHVLYIPADWFPHNERVKSGYNEDPWICSREQILKEYEEAEVEGHIYAEIDLSGMLVRAESAMSIETDV